MITLLTVLSKYKSSLLRNEQFPTRLHLSAAELNTVCKMDEIFRHPSVYEFITTNENAASELNDVMIKHRLELTAHTPLPFPVTSDVHKRAYDKAFETLLIRIHNKTIDHIILRLINTVIYNCPSVRDKLPMPRILLGKAHLDAYDGIETTSCLDFDNISHEQVQKASAAIKDLEATSGFSSAALSALRAELSSMREAAYGYDPLKLSKAPAGGDVSVFHAEQYVTENMVSKFTMLTMSSRKGGRQYVLCGSVRDMQLLQEFVLPFADVEPLQRYMSKSLFFCDKNDKDKEALLSLKTTYPAPFGGGEYTREHKVFLTKSEWEALPLEVSCLAYLLCSTKRSKCLTFDLFSSSISAGPEGVGWASHGPEALRTPDERRSCQWHPCVANW